MSSIVVTKESNMNLRNTVPEVDKSAWEVQAEINRKLLEALYNSVESLFTKFGPVLCPEATLEGGKEEEATLLRDSEVVGHLLFANGRLEVVLRMLDRVKSLSQV